MPDPMSIPSTLPPVPLETPTRESLEAEVARMGDTRTTPALADLLADARELQAAAADIEDLSARGYPVSQGLIDRLGLLITLLEEGAAQRAERLVSLTATQRDEMDRARRRLLAIRAELSLLASAAGLPSDLFVLGTKHSNRLNVVLMRVGEVLRHAERFLDRLPDRARVQALVAEGQALIDAQYGLRANLGLARADLTGETQRLERLERLLLDTLIYLARQGRAAYARDPERRQKYVLDHVYGTRPSRAADPGAGGDTGFADADADAEPNLDLPASAPA